MFPCFEIEPRRAFPPVEFCRGTSPATRRIPPAAELGSIRNRRCHRGRHDRADAWYGLQAPTDLVVAMDTPDLSVELAQAALESFQMSGQFAEDVASKFRHLEVRFVQPRYEPLDAVRAGGLDDAKLREMPF